MTAWQGPGLLERMARLSKGTPRFYSFIGSTKTSTIPGIGIAGPSPEATLLTPSLDSEYFIKGRVVSFDVIPMTPDAIPAPAVVSNTTTTNLDTVISYVPTRLTATLIVAVSLAAGATLQRGPGAGSGTEA